MKRILVFLAVLLVSCDMRFANEDLNNVDGLGSATLRAAPENYCLYGNFGVDDEGKPVGGGLNYPNIYTGSEANAVTVSTYSQLKAALKNANNKLVYVADGAVIEFPYAETLPIHTDVTLAGGRGKLNTCPAIIKSNIFQNYISGDPSSDPDSLQQPLFKFQGDNARITGLVFQGPSNARGNENPASPNIGTTGNPYKLKTCVDTNSANNITIDNCEFTAWPRQAILVYHNSKTNVKILNNYFHENTQIGWGYGINVGGHNAFALIKGNLFWKDRHDVASSGLWGSGYEASYNVFLGDNIQPNLDVHRSDSTSFAGVYQYIHHNSFFVNNDPGLPGTTYAAIQVQAVPAYMCLIEKNRFETNDLLKTVKQTNGTGNVFLLNNLYGWNGNYSFSQMNGKYRGRYVARQWNNRRPIINLSLSQAEPVLEAFTIGDFDGNGTTEIFKVSEGQDGYAQGRWLTTELPTAGSALDISKSWTPRASSPGYHFGNFNFGDFNGNGKTDVLLIDGSIYASDGATSSWQLKGTPPSGDLSKYICGDFNGNGTDDVFLVDGNFFLSEGMTSSWTTLSYIYPYIKTDFGYGYFNSNDTMDVFLPAGNWYLSDGGATSWGTPINVQGESMASLLVGDVHINSGYSIRLTDVIRKNSDVYQFSSAATGAWTDLTYQNLNALLNW